MSPLRPSSLWQRIRSVMFLTPPDAAPLTISATRAPRVALTSVQAQNQVNIAPRILILTSELGHGHTRAAQALRLALLQQCPAATITILDWWSLLNEDVARLIKEIYLLLVQQHPELYEELYHLDEHTWRDILLRNVALPASCQRLLTLIETMYTQRRLPANAHGNHAADRALMALLCSGGQEGMSLAGGLRARAALVKWSWSRLIRRLSIQIEQRVPDAVIATQMIPGALMAAVKQRRGLSTPSIAVPTDFGVHDFWRQTGTNLYCVGHEALTSGLSWLRDGHGDARQVQRSVSATGFALMPEFNYLCSQSQARRSLGLAANVPVILVLGGGLGLGVDGVAECLLRARLGAKILVLAGANEGARTALQASVARCPETVQVLPWTDNVVPLIRAADVVVGKPGGLSVAETLACGRPFLATRSLGGQEGFNVSFMQRLGVGRLVSDQGLVQHLRYLLTHPTELALLQTRAANLVRRDGAKRIANEVLTLIANKAAQPQQEQLTWRLRPDA